MPTQKTTATTAVNAKIREFKRGILKMLAALRKSTSLRLSVLKGFVQQLPHWFASRPTAVKKWLKEDKKKKRYRSFRLQKKLKPEPRYIPSSGALLKNSGKFLYQNKRIFFKIVLIHAVIYLVVLRAPGTTSISTIQNTIKSALGEGGVTSLTGTFATLGAVIGSTAGNQANTRVVTISVVLLSLVYVWAIRQVHAKKTIKARDAYYQGMAPLVPVMILLVIAAFQLIPLAVASFVYGLARSSNLFSNGFEDITVFSITMFIAVLCFYWLTSTVIAFYIATLQGMYPMKALRAAKKLIQFRRLAVFKRIIILPIMITVIYLVLVLAVIRLVPTQVYLVIGLLQIIVIPFVHVYLYKLYRALI